MRKFILLLTCILVLSGCYDYIEINNLSFISAIGIDYNSENYELTFEILSDKKEGENQTTQQADTITGKGKTLAQAFDNITLEISKVPYYHHLSAIVVSETIAKEHMKELTDFLIRSPEIRNEFYLIVATDCDAKKIIESSDETNPSIGKQITRLINSSDYHYNISYNKSFEDVTEKFLSDKIDAVTTALYFKEDKLAIKGIALFKKYEYIETLSEKESALFNILNKDKNNILLTKLYNDAAVSIKIYTSDLNYQIDNNKVILNISLAGELMENNASLDLRKADTYQMLNKDFSEILSENFENLLLHLQEINADALGFNKMQFNKTRKDNQKFIKYANFEVNVKLFINKKGLIFKVENE